MKLSTVTYCPFEVLPSPPLPSSLSLLHAVAIKLDLASVPPEKKPEAVLPGAHGDLKAPHCLSPCVWEHERCTSHQTCVSRPDVVVLVCVTVSILCIPRILYMYSAQIVFRYAPSISPYSQLDCQSFPETPIAEWDTQFELKYKCKYMCRLTL